MCKLCKRVVLVHELGKRRGTEELSDCCYNRTNVNKCLRCEVFAVLNVHSFTNDLVHSGETDTELILEKLTYATQTSVTEMVDIVCAADVVGKTEKVVDCGENILTCNVSGAELSHSALSNCLDLFSITVCFFDDLTENVELYLFACSDILEAVAENVLSIYRSVCEYLNFAAIVHTEVYSINTSLLDCKCVFASKANALLEHNLACESICYRTVEHEAADTGTECKLFIIFITTNRIEVVTLGVEEQIVHEDLCAFNDSGFAGTELLVDFLKSFIADRGMVFNSECFAVVLVESSCENCLVTEEFLDLIGSLDTECTDQYSNRKLSVLINTNIENIVSVSFIFEPCTSVGDNSSGICALTGFINGTIVVDTGGTNYLRNDNTFTTVNNESTCICHKREIAHEDI